MRRRRVAERIGAERAIAVVQGARGSGTHDQFRQSNELFYLCGVEVPHAYLVIGGGDGTAALFLPHQDRHSAEAEGEHLSADNAEQVRGSWSAWIGWRRLKRCRRRCAGRR